MINVLLINDSLFKSPVSKLKFDIIIALIGQIYTKLLKEKLSPTPNRHVPMVARALQSNWDYRCYPFMNSLETSHMCCTHK